MYNIYLQVILSKKRELGNWNYAVLNKCLWYKTKFLLNSGSFVSSANLIYWLFDMRYPNENLRIGLIAIYWFCNYIKQGPKWDGTIAFHGIYFLFSHDKIQVLFQGKLYSKYVIRTIGHRVYYILILDCFSSIETVSFLTL